MIHHNTSINYAGTQGFALSNHAGGPASSNASSEPLELFVNSQTGTLIALDRPPTLSQVLDPNNTYSFFV